MLQISSDISRNEAQNTMKVNGIYFSNSVSGIKNTPTVAPGEKNRPPAGHDDLAVSENAQLFQRVLQKAKELPDIQEDKVQTIQKQIEDGQFNLDAFSLARGILGL